MDFHEWSEPFRSDTDIFEPEIHRSRQWWKKLCINKLPIDNLKLLSVLYDIHIDKNIFNRIMTADPPCINEKMTGYYCNILCPLTCTSDNWFYPNDYPLMYSRQTHGIHYIEPFLYDLETEKLTDCDNSPNYDTILTGDTSILKEEISAFSDHLKKVYKHGLWKERFEIYMPRLIKQFIQFAEIFADNDEEIGKIYEDLRRYLVVLMMNNPNTVEEVRKILKTLNTDPS